MVDRQRGHRRLEAARRTEQVAGHRFRRRADQFLAVGAEQLVDGHDLDAVARRRRRPVRVDVIDLARFDPGVLQRRAHRADRTVSIFRRSRNVESVAAHPVAGELGVDVGAAGQRRLALLEDQDARAFAHHEAVAPGVERPARPLGFVVARRQRLHRAESADGERRDHRLGTAGDHRVGITVLDHAGRFADRVRARGAGGRAGQVGALRPEQDGDLPGGHVEDHPGDEKRRNPARSALRQERVLGFEELQAADTGADVDARAFGVAGADLVARVGQRLTRRRDGEVGEGIHLADVLLVHHRQRVEPAHLSRYPRTVVARVEAGDRSDAAFPGKQGLPRALAIEAQRRQQPDAGDDNASAHEGFLWGLFRV